MKAEIFSEWFRRRGYKVIESESSFWCNVSFQVYQAFPYHWEIAPSRDELNCVLRNGRALALRYSSKVDGLKGNESYYVHYEGNEFPLSRLSKKPRKDIKDSLEYARVSQISLERLAEEGWTNRWETLTRQNRQSAETRDWWRQLCIAAVGLPGFMAWGVMRDNVLIASALTFICDDVISILYQQSSTSHLQYGVNNLLAYTITSRALSEMRVRKVFYGLQSLDAPTSVDAFKFRMGFIAKPIKQCVEFNKVIAPLMNSHTYKVVHQLHRYLPKNPQLSKLDGLIGAYLGKNLGFVPKETQHHV